MNRPTSNNAICEVNEKNSYDNAINIRDDFTEEPRQLDLSDSKFGDVDIKRSKNIHFGSQFINSSVTLVDSSGKLGDETLIKQNDRDNISRQKHRLIVYAFGILILCVCVSFMFSYFYKINVILPSTTTTTITTVRSTFTSTVELTTVTVPYRFWFQNRESWGALSANKCESIMYEIQYVYFYKVFNLDQCKDEHTCILSMGNRQYQGMSTKGDISEHFIIGGDNCVYEGRATNCSSARTVQASETISKTFHYSDVLNVGMTLRDDDNCLNDKNFYANTLNNINKLLIYLTTNVSVSFETCNILYSSFCRSDALAQTFSSNYNFTYFYPDSCSIIGVEGWSKCN